MKPCHGCGKQAENLKSCSVCAKANYCSADCQKSDWDAHKPKCTEAGVEQLLKAIEENNRAEVERLATTKRVVNARLPHEACEEGWTALHHCIRLDTF